MFPQILSRFPFLVWKCLFSYLANHPRRGSLDGKVEYLHQPPMCKLSISSRTLSKTKAQEPLTQFEELMLSSRLTRIVAGAPPNAPPPWGATQPSLLRAELCKYAPFPFLLPSAGLNANSKYSHRAALRAMENSNKYCRNNSKLTTLGPRVGGRAH